MLLESRAIDDDLRARRIPVDFPTVDDDDPYGQRNIAWHMEHGHDWIRGCDLDLIRPEHGPWGT